MWLSGAVIIFQNFIIKNLGMPLQNAKSIIILGLKTSPIKWEITSFVKSPCYYCWIQSN